MTFTCMLLFLLCTCGCVAIHAHEALWYTTLFAQHPKLNIVKIVMPMCQLLSDRPTSNLQMEHCLLKLLSVGVAISFGHGESQLKDGSLHSQSDLNHAHSILHGTDCSSLRTTYSLSSCGSTWPPTLTLEEEGVYIKEL